MVSKGLPLSYPLMVSETRCLACPRGAANFFPCPVFSLFTRLPLCSLNFDEPPSLTYATKFTLWGWTNRAT